VWREIEVNKNFLGLERSKFYFINLPLSRMVRTKADNCAKKGY